MLLQINGLSKKYSTLDGEIVALDNVSLRIDKGELVSVIGKSGSGKTTLLNMIGGLDTPDSGSIIFDGADITALSQRRTAELRRRKIGIIYQFYNLIPELNVAENILLPCELDGREPNMEWFRKIMKMTGLEGREQAYPADISGGQQQRTAIARALLFEPSLILADEPTGNLDPENSAEILRLLKYMNEELGSTVIIVTHSMSVAENTKRVIELSDGAVIRDRREGECRPLLK